jgi:hypothetical protein
MILVIPIYKGGDLFLGAIDSIEKLQIQFKKIVLSFNEALSVDYDLFIQTADSQRYRQNYTILRTGLDLDAVEHGLFIVNNLKPCLDANDKIFFLAHDDRVLNDGEDGDLYQFLIDVEPNTVYFPSYSCCKVDDYNDVFEVIESDNVYTPKEFFWLTQQMNVPTSMSGMIVPFASWNEALRVMSRAGSGARFEHLLSIAASTKKICFNKFVRVLIAQRKGSDADHLSLMQHRLSSFYYVVTFIRNRRMKGFIEYCHIGWILFKKIGGLVTQFFLNIFRC